LGDRDGDQRFGHVDARAAAKLLVGAAQPLGQRPPAVGVPEQPAMLRVLTQQPRTAATHGTDRLGVAELERRGGNQSGLSAQIGLGARAIPTHGSRIPSVACIAEVGAIARAAVGAALRGRVERAVEAAIEQRSVEARAERATALTGVQRIAAAIEGTGRNQNETREVVDPYSDSEHATHGDRYGSPVASRRAQIESGANGRERANLRSRASRWSCYHSGCMMRRALAAPHFSPAVGRYGGIVSVQKRNNVRVIGRGQRDMIFSHGYGCDQNMWRLLTPAFEDDYRIILFDLVGSGRSELAAYDFAKYGTLQGHADDVVEILAEFAHGPAVFVGHSVSGMIGLLAAIRAPERFSSQVMIGPSPSYVNDGDYVGGFTRQDIESLLDTLDSNYLGWASAMAPTIMGAPDQPELAIELTNSFCATDPRIAKHFARVTFLSDNRADLPKFKQRTLLLQSSDDLIAPLAVGEYLHRMLPDSVLKVIDNIGHCPHLSAPAPIAAAMREFL
jgi:sigma-B regulation protein RsbQ